MITVVGEALEGLGGGGTGLEESFDLSTESWVLRYNT